MLNKIQLFILSIATTVSFSCQADEIVNFGECQGFKVSECREIRNGIYSKTQPIFCKKNNSTELSRKEQAICEARHQRQQQLANSPDERKQKEYLDDQAALLEIEFEPLLISVDAMAALLKCNMTESRPTDFAIAQIHRYMDGLVFKSRIGPEQGIYTEELVRSAVMSGEKKATKKWCSSVKPETRATVRNLIQNLISTSY